jgi:type I restriction enzyme M protein
LEEKTVNKVLELINGYSFVTMGMDIKGKVYELYLGSTMKNTALGQYFTPEKIIDFMVDLADLKVRDVILDPCCGTGRFLTKSMDYLIDKAKKNPEFIDEDIEKIKKRQFHGIDLSKAVYKISRMNMYIHGDGKTNIARSNMITYNPFLKDNDKTINLKGKFKVVLTNPPFGDINIVEDVENFEDNEKQILNEFPKIDVEETEVTSSKKVVNIKSKGYKGGSLLLQRMEVMLEKEGKLLTIIDEGVLNTNGYKKSRDFIRDNYFIKAVISLPQTTFKKLAKSSPKASIIYIIKKKNILDKQVEPVFFAKASMVGVDTRGKLCRNDFNMILEEFKKFSDEIKTNIENHNGFFNKNAFNFEKFSDIPKKSWWNYEGDPELMYYIAYIDDLNDRMDFTYNRPDFKEEIEKIKKYGYVKLEDLLKNGNVKGLTPDKDGKKEIPLLTIKNIERNGTVNYKDLAYVSKDYFEDRKQQMGVDKGDILLAITGATIGKTAIFNDDKVVAICGDIAKMQPKNKDDIKSIRNFLNSYLGQMQIKKVINGSTNFHLSPKDVDEIVIPELIKKDGFKDVIDDFDIIIQMLDKVVELKEDAEIKKRELIPQLLKTKDSFEEYQKYVKEMKKKLRDLNL